MDDRGGAAKPAGPDSPKASAAAEPAASAFTPPSGPPVAFAPPPPPPGRAPRRTSGGSGPEPGEPPAGPPPRRGRRRAGVAALGVVGAAVAGAIATAVITPERFDWLLATVMPWTQSQSETATEYKRVSAGDGALAFDVPVDWVQTAGSWNYEIGGVLDTGTGSVVGDDPENGVFWGENGVWVGASVDAAARLGFPGGSPAMLAAWGAEHARLNDWSSEGCVRAADTPPAPAGVIGEVRAWADCGATPGVRQWELFSVTDDGESIVMAQITLSEELPDVVAAHVLESIVVSPDLVASDPPTGTGDRAVTP